VRVVRVGESISEIQHLVTNCFPDLHGISPYFE
jgi:hypothetical protein